jgi:hypothetical protein
MAYIGVSMRTRPINVAEVWSEAECLAFADFIVRNPETGDVIPESGGVRKVRAALSADDLREGLTGGSLAGRQASGAGARREA